jgi:hypothetical protein
MLIYMFVVPPVAFDKNNASPLLVVATAVLASRLPFVPVTPVATVEAV